MPDRAGPLVVIAGPTASGKSALALDLAEALAGTVINGDSMQIYAGLGEITAAPGPAETARLPHRLYGVRDPALGGSVAWWLDAAAEAVAEARAAGRLPIVVGGTGLYLKALIEGLADLPEVPEAARQAARADLEALGAAGLHARLAEVDGPTAGRLAPNDRQRIVRAWEVWRATGRPLSHWQAEAIPRRRIAGPVFLIALRPPREAVHRAAEVRLRAMFDGAAPAEVAALMARGLPPDTPALKAIGVVEIAAWQRGEMSREAALAAAQQATRRYVKRQMTWLATQMRPNMVVPAQYSESLLPDMLRKVRAFLLTAGD
ncbi:tRNA (adenosine(37)-N6)-dimethylallyltransferase MiaA [Roseospirillum parvum]|uniref:tRNA dimethylallyltransferase n=1 Tax=Roseospirillum parvum TaxID=83401 RepID=A0A1G8E543_9PROT|nr:tRNA (adenosine(37)-N6)-dimethylallyltransferase MiaA [Roseospirillum parvum]SDH65033.1 tRNA dimethylallyltransferase [Roseospirillum parvum]